jgi:hypothetical protein
MYAHDISARSHRNGCPGSGVGGARTRPRTSGFLVRCSAYVGRLVISVFGALIMPTIAGGMTIASCPPTTFIIRGGPLMGASSDTNSVSLLPATPVVPAMLLLASGCGEIVPNPRIKSLRRGLRIRAVWSSTCAAFPAHVKLVATVRSSCAKIKGVLTASPLSSKSEAGKVKRRFEGDALPACGATVDGARVQAAVATQAASIADVWSDAGAFIHLIAAVETQIGCSIASPTAIEERDSGFDKTIQYCGPGNSADGKHGVISKLGITCIDEGCEEHDACYQRVCLSAGECAFDPNLWPPGDDCDAQLYSWCLGRCARPAPFFFADWGTALVCNIIDTRKAYPLPFSCGDPPCSTDQQCDPAGSGKCVSNPGGGGGGGGGGGDEVLHPCCNCGHGVCAGGNSANTLCTSPSDCPDGDCIGACFVGNVLGSPGVGIGTTCDVCLWSNGFTEYAYIVSLDATGCSGDCVEFPLPFPTGSPP